MANPRSIVAALHSNWDTVEALVRLSREHLIFNEEQLFQQISRIHPQLDKEERASVVRQLLNRDILQPLPRSDDFQLNSAVLDFVRSLTHEHELELSEVFKARVNALRDQTENINQGMANNDLDRVRRAAANLSELVRLMLKQLHQDRHAVLEIAEKAKSSDNRMPLAHRYQMVNEKYDRYIEPMNQLIETSREGLFYRYLEEAEKALDIARDTLSIQGALYTHRSLVKQTAYLVKELRSSAREVLQQCVNTLLPLRDELRQESKLSSAISAILGQVRKRGSVEALQPRQSDLKLPVWHTIRFFRLHAGDEVREWIAHFKNYQPVAVAFPEDIEASFQGELIEFVDEAAIRTQLQQALPIMDLLLWLHEHHSHLRDSTLLRLFHSFHHDETLDLQNASQESQLDLQVIRVKYYPYQVSSIDE